jgi:hypothetical protein
MKPSLAFITFIFTTVLINAQENITSFIKLDTIFSTNIKIDNEDVTVNNVKIRILKNEAWLYYPNWKDNDSIHFLKINLSTYKKELINIYVPSISFKIPTPTITDFDINSDALVLLFTNHSFAYFKNTRNGYNFDFIEPLQSSFYSIRLLPNDQMLIYNNYNSHPKDNPDKTILHIYDCLKHKLLYSSKPYFNSIEFCHFSPNQWLDVNSKNIVFSQTTSYSISFFNFNLSLANNFITNERDWVYADTNKIKALESVKPRITPKDFIDRLSPIEDSVSRIEAIYSLNDTKLLIRKIPANAKKQNRLRTYDILALNRKTNKWDFIHKNIVDVKADPNATSTKASFPVNSVYNNVAFSENFFVKLQPRFTPFEFGKTFKENKENEDKALGTVVPELYIQIFKANYN